MSFGKIIFGTDPGIIIGSPHWKRHMIRNKKKTQNQERRPTMTPSSRRYSQIPSKNQTPSTTPFSVDSARQAPSMNQMTSTTPPPAETERRPPSMNQTSSTVDSVRSILLVEHRR
jgi:hypothetical protein